MSMHTPAISDINSTAQHNTRQKQQRKSRSINLIDENNTGLPKIPPNQPIPEHLPV